MTPAATRFLSAGVALLVGASASWACDHGAKTAQATSASACVSKVSASKASCPAVGTTAAKGASVKKATTRKSAAVSKRSPSTAGMRAEIDPETGMIGGVAPRLPRVEALSGDSRDVVLTETPVSPRGFTVNVEGVMEDYTVLRIDAQGRRVMTCTPNPKKVLQSRPVAKSNPNFPEK